MGTVSGLQEQHGLRLAARRPRGSQVGPAPGHSPDVRLALGRETVPALVPYPPQPLVLPAAAGGSDAFRSGAWARAIQRPAPQLPGLTSACEPAPGAPCPCGSAPGRAPRRSACTAVRHATRLWQPLERDMATTLLDLVCWALSRGRGQHFRGGSSGTAGRALRCGFSSSSLLLSSESLSLGGISPAVALCTAPASQPAPSGSCRTCRPSGSGARLFCLCGRGRLLLVLVLAVAGWQHPHVCILTCRQRSGTAALCSPELARLIGFALTLTSVSAQTATNRRAESTVNTLLCTRAQLRLPL